MVLKQTFINELMEWVCKMIMQKCISRRFNWYLIKEVYNLSTLKEVSHLQSFIPRIIS